MHDIAKNVQAQQVDASSAITPSYKEHLPPLCPPSDASPPARQKVWRFTDNNPVIAHDFLSYRALKRQVLPGTDACRASSCSVFTAPCELSKLPKLREKFVAELNIDEKSGLAKKKRKHIDLWMFTSFDPVANTSKVFEKSDLKR